MTIRTAIEQLLSGPLGFGDGSSDPAEALAEQGFGDVSGELFGTALEHFSDTAPLAQADALAPVVTRVSSVPYEAEDLAPLGGDGIDGEASESGDAFALFETVAPTVSADVDAADAPDIDNVDDAETDEASAFGSGAGDVEIQLDDSEQPADVDEDEVPDEFGNFADTESVDALESPIDDHGAFSYEPIDVAGDAADDGHGDDDGFDDIDFAE